MPEPPRDAQPAGGGASGRRDGVGRYRGLIKALPLLSLTSVVLNLLSLALPLALLQVYDRIVPNSSRGTLLILILGVAVAVGFEAILRIARSTMTGWIAARFEHRAGCAAFERILHAPLGCLDRDGSGVHLERMAAIPAMKDFHAEQGTTTLLDLPFVAVFLLLVWILGGLLVAVPLTCLALFALAMAADGHRLQRALRHHNALRDRRLNFLVEVLHGIHAVKSMAMEAQMLQRYTRLQASIAAADHDVIRRGAAAQALGNLFSQITMIAVAAAGSLMVIDQQLTVGGLAACTLLAGRSLNPVQRAVGAWSRFQSVRLLRERADSIFAMAQEPRPVVPLRNTVSGALELRSVSLCYTPGGRRVLDDVSLAIEPGACIGILGGNGSGKSSLLAIMRGSLPATAGDVLLDGHPVAAWDPEYLRRTATAYLPTKAHLFRGTLIDNVTMFRRDLRAAAVEVAAELGLDEIVRALPHGWHTQVADGVSDAMPRGLRQRLAIVRALVSDPRIILFDEANTAVDGSGDEKLRGVLERRKGYCTLVLVTLRPSLLRLADRRFELVGGRLVARDDGSLVRVKDNDSGNVPALAPLGAA